MIFNEGYEEIDEPSHRHQIHFWPKTASWWTVLFLFQVDESVLSSEAGEDPPLPPPPPPSYPWIQMALPGGGIVSVPLHGDTSSEPGASGSNPHHPKALAPQGQGQPIPTTTVPGLDLLTVPAGEPVTHFNLVSAMWHYIVLYSSVLTHTMILSTCFYPKKLCFGLLFLHSVKFKCEWTTTIGGR